MGKSNADKQMGKIRAARLKRVRNLTNFSRQEFCEDSDIKLNTLKAWEMGRYGGLTQKGAKKIIERCQQAGVLCSLDWLMDGIGFEPTLIPRQSNLNEPSSLLNATQAALSEIALFQQLHPLGIATEILDDALAPQFNIGDYVAGIRYSNTDMHNGIGKNCIVQTTAGQSLVRHVKASSTPNTFTLICTNLNAQAKQPIISDTTLTYLAPIIRHYKR